jgi:hypothetical protein
MICIENYFDLLFDAGVFEKFALAVEGDTGTFCLFHHRDFLSHKPDGVHGGSDWPAGFSSEKRMVTVDVNNIPFRKAFVA